MNYPQKYNSRESITLPDEKEVKKVVGASYDPSKTLNVLKMFAGTGDMYQATVGLVQAVFTTSGIKAQTREVIILRAAKILNVPYEWQANIKMAHNVGLSHQDIAEIAKDEAVTGIDDEFVLVCQATDELSLRGTLDDKTLVKIKQHFGEEGSRKIILMISWFNLLSRFLNGCVFR